MNTTVGMIGIFAAVVFIGLIAGRRRLKQKKFKDTVSYIFTEEAKKEYKELIGDFDGYDEVFEKYRAYIRDMERSSRKKLETMAYYEQGLGLVKITFHNFLKNAEEPVPEEASAKAKDLAKKDGFKTFPYAEV